MAKRAIILIMDDDAGEAHAWELGTFSTSVEPAPESWDPHGENVPGVPRAGYRPVLLGIKGERRYVHDPTYFKGVCAYALLTAETEKWPEHP
jgi:hypothetical protein